MIPNICNKNIYFIDFYFFFVDPGLGNSCTISVRFDEDRAVVLLLHLKFLASIIKYVRNKNLAECFSNSYGTRQVVSQWRRPLPNLSDVSFSANIFTLAEFAVYLVVFEDNWQCVTCSFLVKA